MTQKQLHETVRFTVDFPADQHMYIKMMAAREGITMRQFVIDHLPRPKLRRQVKEAVKKRKFNTLLDEIMTEYADELKSLSKK